ncbi:hypothetical protein ARMGADRAFT_1089316 [Armillaria gallica]|uniref:Uncharacterized protein n=1 Tax=Armillaria gallica TaxID=47427 RepID=A0A2H3D558_ARMGA|nr:hypothetical protein ARMGADRAFT_1089316 [Armillaria gallica]
MEANVTLWAAEVEAGKGELVRRARYGPAMLDMAFSDVPDACETLSKSLESTKWQSQKKQARYKYTFYVRVQVVLRFLSFVAQSFFYAGRWKRVVWVFQPAPALPYTHLQVDYLARKSPFFLAQLHLAHTVYPTNLQSLHQSPTSLEASPTTPSLHGDRGILAPTAYPAIDVTSHKDDPACFEREFLGHITASVHPTTVTLHEIIIDKPYVYVVLDLCAGSDTSHAIATESSTPMND